MMSDPEPALFLFDIDGTIMRGGTEVHKAAFACAYQEVYGLELSLDGIPPSGRTDTWLFAEPLRRFGMQDEEIWVGLPAAFDCMQQYVEEHLGDLHGYVLPGVPQLLAALRDRGELLGLLTGNLSRIAWAKMRHAGLDAFFVTGGFGEESETRSFLDPAALQAANEWLGYPVPPHRAVLIGDTPMDIEAGQIHGTLTVGVATGHFSVAELRACGADLVLASFAETDEVISALLTLVR